MSMTRHDSAEPNELGSTEPRIRSRLRLSDGRVFEGRTFGADRAVRGEVVFLTGMTGYVETLTDPSYFGQIVVFTYPLMGNYGVPEGPFEAPRIHAQGVVVHGLARSHSHAAAKWSLHEWLSLHGVPGLCGVDTRALTQHLRSNGAMEGTLGHEQHPAPAPPDMRAAARLVTPPEWVRLPGRGPSILVIDSGAKESIIRSLAERGAAIIRAPFMADWEAVLPQVSGVVLSNGPGDPADLMDFASRIRGLLRRNTPVFGICLGHQVLALAAGAATYKLPYGHRSHNQPVVDLGSGRAFITSQNHGYAVDARTLPPDWEEWFVNLNDNSNEGIRHAFLPFRSVQFHPEAAAGPKDTNYLFDDFLRMVTAVTRRAP